MIQEAYGDLIMSIEGERYSAGLPERQRVIYFFCTDTFILHLSIYLKLLYNLLSKDFSRLILTADSNVLSIPGPVRNRYHLDWILIISY